MSYRDDRRALEERNEALEDEVAELRAELAKAEGTVALAPRDDEQGLAKAEAKRVTALPLLVLGLVLAGGVFALGVPVVGVQIAVLMVTLSLSLWFAGRRVVVPAPHEAVVLSGGGGPKPVSVLHGATVPVPLLHRTDLMDLGARAVTVPVDEAFSRGGTPATLRVEALVGIALDAELAERAVSRFLGHDEEIERVAAELLEGHLREIAAQRSLEQLCRDRAGVNAALAHAAQADFDERGLVLLGAWLVRVDDDRGELDNAVRPQVADALRRAEVLASEAT